uniref:Uncharacterized protein n=1 Tax=Helianthus annuus TaxID=4232 RepID=A0A251SXW8_HELAN
MSFPSSLYNSWFRHGCSIFSHSTCKIKKKIDLGPNVDKRVQGFKISQHLGR